METMREYRDALRWLTNACCGVSRDGCEVSAAERQEALENAMEVLDKYPQGTGDPESALL